MSTALNRFIEAGERRLAELEEPERTIVAAKLHNEILRRFPGGIDANPDLEFDGNYLFDGPLSAKDVEDKIEQDHIDKEDSKTASEMAEEGCYGDGGEEESDHGGYRFRPIPIDQGLKREATEGLKKAIGAVAIAKGFSPEEAEAISKKALEEGTQTFAEAPDVVTMASMVDNQPPIETESVIGLRVYGAKDAVSLGQIYEEEMAEKQGFAQSRRGYHDRTSHLIFRAGQSWKTAAKTKKSCEFCEREFLGTKNARFCNMCRSPQMCAIRRRTKVEDLA